MRKKSIFAVLGSLGKVTALMAMMLLSLIFSGCSPDDDESLKHTGEFDQSDSKSEKTGGGKTGGRIKDIVEEVGPSVVNIVADSSDTITKGSGVLFSAEGYIITNDHVVRDSNSLEVHLSDKRTLKAKRIGVDSRMDVAVIQVEGDNLPVARLGDSDDVQIGTDVVAIGNAKGVENSATEGIISNRDIDVDDGINIKRCLQTSAPINPGNSGGALVNMQGEVIGINSMSRKNAESMNYAIPINAVHKVARQIIDKGYVSHPYLGVNAVNEEIKNGSIIIKVSDVMPDSPAAKEFQKNDIIIKVNGIQVNTVSKLREQLDISGIGSIVSVYIKRGNQEGTIQVKLEELPKGYYTIDWS